MNTKRIEEIQKETAYPDSRSVQQALLKVWNECEQEKAVKNNAALPHVIGSLLTDAQSYEIAQKFYEYCYMQQDDSLAIGAKAIPLIFDECLKMLASNDRYMKCTGIKAVSYPDALK